MAKQTATYFYRLADIPLVPLTDRVGTRFIAGQNLMGSFIEQPAGATFPLHSHPAEQMLIILEGTEEHICGDQKFLMKAGDVCVHPPNVPHGGHTDTGYKGIDVFSPLREDYLALMRKHGLLK